MVLTSRNVDGSTHRFILYASSAEIRLSWANDIIQILDSQRNFLNGIIIIVSFLTLPWPCHSLVFNYSKLPSFVPQPCSLLLNTRGKQLNPLAWERTWQKHSLWTLACSPTALPPLTASICPVCARSTPGILHIAHCLIKWLMFAGL